ncbi:MAG: hypothetical protein NTX96_02395 [Candidatus Zambryskibacteria bacterium]|nr:hypothetical protein [Candidatus Zambryskibacteria bacterium]
MNTRLFRHAFLLLFVIAVLNLIASIFYLHWTIWWFDTVLHLLAGAVIAMTVVLFLQYFYDITSFNLLKIILIAIVVSFIVGILWELYELYFGITFLSDGMIYVVDTISDLTTDVCGAFLGILYSKSFLLEKNER